MIESSISRTKPFNQKTSQFSLSNKNNTIKDYLSKIHEPNYYLSPLINSQNNLWIKNHRQSHYYKNVTYYGLLRDTPKTYTLIWMVEWFFLLIFSIGYLLLAMSTLLALLSFIKNKSTASQYKKLSPQESLTAKKYLQC